MKVIDKLIRQIEKDKGIIKLIPQDLIETYVAYEHEVIQEITKQISFEPEPSERFFFKTFGQSLKEGEALAIIITASPYKIVAEEHPIGLGVIDYNSYMRDYHLTIKEEHEKLDAFIQGELHLDLLEQSIDTSPYIEREIAFMCGLGDYGKNHFIMHPTYGTAYNMGILLYKISKDQFKKWQDHVSYNKLVDPVLDRPRNFKGCETCNRCVKACPTQILGGAKIDKSRCVSQLTQTKEEIHLEDQIKMSNRLYGCQNCQLACPYNRVSKVYTKDHYLELDKLFILSQKKFKREYADKGFTWRGVKVLKRNALIVIKNQGNSVSQELEALVKEDAFLAPYL